MNFYDHLEAHGSSIAIQGDPAGTLSYTELALLADSVRGNVVRRCLVFCLCENRWEALAGYLGFLRGRIVPVLLSSGLGRDSLSGLLSTYQPEFVWAPVERATDLGPGLEIFRLGGYALFRTNSTNDYSMHSDLALLMTTSGSTGSPMLVRQSYANIISNTESICNYLQISEKDRPITSLPMNYTYGLSIINSHLQVGAELVLTNRSFMDKGFWELIRRTQVTTFGGVPYSYEILKKLRFSRMDLPSLRVLTQAGGKLNPGLASEFAQICQEKGIQLFIMYGQTEATARMSYLPSSLAKTKFSSIGIAIPGGEFWIENDSGYKITESGPVGELVYRGENVTLGYAQNRFDLSKEDENGGILRTGDMAWYDEDGFYHVVGRKKRFLKLFGNRVNLDEVEQGLRKNGIDCACAGCDDLMKIFITDDLADAAAVKRMASELTQIHQTAFEVVGISEIPRNEFGKVQYSQLK